MGHHRTSEAVTAIPKGFRSLPRTSSSTCNPRAIALGLIVSTVVLLGPSANGAERGHLTVPTPGGMPTTPLITSVQAGSNQVTLNWQNFCGPYQVWLKRSATDPHWQAVTGPQYSETATIGVLYSNAFFRVSGPSPRFAGDRACEECHAGVHASALGTRHARAYKLLQDIGQQNNQSCLPCHTVGYGTPTGFRENDPRRAHLAGVQCESCHGPAALHAANENDPLVRPRVEIAGQLCGGCHMGVHQPDYPHPGLYEDWAGSGHAIVTEDMNPASRINSCGRCHSGPSRLALLKGLDPAVAVAGDANIGVSCVVCHNPHQNTAHPYQLRNPVASTNDYFLTTTEAFSSKYNPSINLCAQCHNHRGATWTSSGRPPHHSPQYNMMLGSIGELPVGIAPAGASAHGRRIAKQCVGCHMPAQEFHGQSESVTPRHTFKVESYLSCAPCHPFPEPLAQFTMLAVSAQIEQLKQALDLWATSKAPEALRTKYGVRAWEYTVPGELSSGGAGPTAAEQAQVPDAIKKARFNLYLVKYDGSYGVHNGPHAIKLLDAARSWIQEELNK